MFSKTLKFAAGLLIALTGLLSSLGPAQADVPGATHDPLVELRAAHAQSLAALANVGFRDWLQRRRNAYARYTAERNRVHAGLLLVFGERAVAAGADEVEVWRQVHAEVFRFSTRRDRTLRGYQGFLRRLDDELPRANVE